MTTTVKQPYEELPAGPTPIWRYMDLPKLPSLFERQSLFLCRADRLGEVVTLPFFTSFVA
mgnify:CR=1 FL=1